MATGQVSISPDGQGEFLKTFLVGRSRPEAATAANGALDRVQDKSNTRLRGGR